jgi:perosamine synthetase
MSKLIRSSKPFFPKEDLEPLLADIRRILEEGQFRNGENVKTFEAMVARYIGVGGAVAFDSDSSAYETALRFFNPSGGEVVVCTNSFISVPNSVVNSGGKVVFADIKADTLSMDSESLLQNLTPNTRGVIVTHIAGFPNPDLKTILKICQDHHLFLIEDATHAIGATVSNQKVGSFGDAAVFAFTPTKVLTTGEGGMLVTNNSELREFAKRYRYYGSGFGKTEFADLGRHMMLPEVSAVLGIYQLRRLEEFLKRRNEIAKIYNEAFKDTPDMQTIACPTENRCSYYKYPLILNKKTDKHAFTQTLFEDFGIETGTVFYPPCHLQEVYKKIGASSYGSLSAAEDVLSRTITLPMHAALCDEDALFVTQKISQLLRDNFAVAN